MKKKLHDFGQWVKVDGKDEGQVISYYNGFYTIDINGMWDKIHFSRVSKG